MKNVTISRGLPLDNYVNKETGELISSELGKGTRITITQETPNVIVESDEYFIIDIEALTYLRQHGVIKIQDETRLLSMFMTLKTEYNATYNNTIPHTLETLSHLIGLSYDKTTVLVKRLCKSNIMHRYITATDTLYCINPYLGRRRKTISKELISLFNKFPVITPDNKKITLRIPAKTKKVSK
jgi:hypothetical protein